MGTECFEMRSVLKYSRLIFRVPLLGSLLSVILGRSQCISPAQLSPTKVPASLQLPTLLTEMPASEAHTKQIMIIQEILS